MRLLVAVAVAVAVAALSVLCGCANIMYRTDGREPNRGPYACTCEMAMRMPHIEHLPSIIWAVTIWSFFERRA